MPVRSFTDTSAVSLAYALGDGIAPADFAATPFFYIPYTSEGFQMSKEAKKSTAITNDRRASGSKNTKGSASGSATMEFGGPQFIRDMLAMALMSDWKNVNNSDPLLGKYLIDSDVKKFMCVEKTTRSGTAAADKQFYGRYYGTMVNDSTLKFGDGELVTFDVNTISMFADYSSLAQGVDGKGGQLSSALKAIPPTYEIADSSNNLKSLVVRDPQGVPMEMTFSDASLQMQNNVREQSGLGKEFAAGVGIGKVDVNLSGEVYFFDQTVLNAHMTNKRLSAEMVIQTTEGTYNIYLPVLTAQSPTNSSDGENQDYKTKLTLAAERGSVLIGAATVVCAIAIVFVPTP
jgi:hypothetical protein